MYFPYWLQIKNNLRNICPKVSFEAIAVIEGFQPFRLSLVGALKDPHLFNIVELIGKDETIKRLEKAISSL
ncbi:hypothetical protein [Flavobacterium sp.]|uniref:hypothetical protein n=1 Tax=Flavobacterium sp. TaxID=239 RepID=UPI0025D3BC0D|nr:hypothetical protein [Flavobacterium sp.]